MESHLDIFLFGEYMLNNRMNQAGLCVPKTGASTRYLRWMNLYQDDWQKQISILSTSEEQTTEWIRQPVFPISQWHPSVDWFTLSGLVLPLLGDCNDDDNGNYDDKDGKDNTDDNNDNNNKVSATKDGGDDNSDNHCNGDAD